MTHPSNTVSVIGADGMLGRAVVRALKENAKDFNIHKVTAGVCSELAPYVINCAGIVRGREVSAMRMALVNARLPHAIAENPDVKRLVHVSTDCVFNGLDGPYSEDSQPTPTDLYSRTKLAGEVIDNDKVLTVRTSFIGFGEHGLLRWLLTQPEGAVVDGYMNHIWNGLYVGNVARILVHLCLRKRITGLLHLDGDTTTKFELLNSVAEILRPDIEVVPAYPAVRKHVLICNRAIDIRSIASISMRQLFEDYYKWGKDYLCSLS